MNHLVKRLRENAKHYALELDTHLLLEAADYIEVLEKELDVLKNELNALHTFQKGF
jgi:hypothetical protein